MPRITGRLIRKACSDSPLLPHLLRGTRSMEQARAELRWIQRELPKAKWKNAVLRRSIHEPLQYILGTQPFGSIDIICKSGALIPRWETEEWVSELSQILSKSSHSPKILDVCTGTGCIPLLLKTNLPETYIGAFDKSETAYKLAILNRDNLGLDVDIWKDDVFNFEAPSSLTNIDLITSNPPYIPLEEYKMPPSHNGPDKSVKMYEPKMALVGNLEFYEALVNYVVLPLKAKGFVFELCNEDQAIKTAQLLPQHWTCGRYFDTAGKLRCVVGWENSTHMANLSDLVNGGFISVTNS